MRFTLSIDTDNAAFTDRRNEEVAAILQQLASWVDRADEERREWRVFDVNGNTVGRALYHEARA